MQKFILVIATVLFFETAFCQGVGIGTTNPNSSALLHLNSTTKGLLIPSMTSSQRIALNSPAEGLLVYDLTAERTFQYQGGTWRLFITNDYWAQSGTRKWVYNGTDSIGIGTAAPNERLHISNGNVRISGDLRLSGYAGVGTFAPEQALHIRSSVASEGILLDAANPIIQLRQSNSPAIGYTEKGFIQLSDDNLRIGTNSSNTNGKLVVRTAGADRVSFDANGMEMENDARITKPATGNANLLPVAYGRTASVSTGGIAAGTSNVTVTRIQTGWYQVSCSCFTSSTVLLATPIASGVTVSATYSSGSFSVITRSISTMAEIDQVFNFIAY